MDRIRTPKNAPVLMSKSFGKTYLQFSKVFYSYLLKTFMKKNIKNSIYICKNYSKTGTIPGFAEKMKTDGSGYSLLHKAAEVLGDR